MEAGLPNIAGSLTSGGTVGAVELATFRSGTGAFSVSTVKSYHPSGYFAATTYYSASFSAKKSNAIYGSSNTVTPLSRACIFYIKF